MASTLQGRRKCREIAKTRESSPASRGGQGLSGDDDDDEEEPDDIVHTYRGAGGIFVSTQETGRSRTSIQDSWLVSTPMAGGPKDGIVIPSYGGHVAAAIWGGVERGVLRSFVERWQPDTNIFHLSFGEMMIMLHGVYHILEISIDGTMVFTVMDPLQLRVLETTFNVERPPEISVVAFMWVLLGSSLFVDKSGNILHPSLIHELQLVNGTFVTSSYSWGFVTLAFLYHQLGQASRADCDSISGCLMLLQEWIYEYFPCFRPQQGTLTRDPGRVRALLWDVGSPSKTSDRLFAFRA
ncbi:protein MAINTENANCE OF MERISTEMS-like [Chenopodium quinoa]|uniref:protein MAINTENANCE OF MERISTEMS-like n=1 Tax=Chenopodium quinoa TaxID=63459 RepID=UPI000B77F352|nr:protein MAINTENANCE OF MERISTEMS-like [Chenopodium quinoa]